MDKYLSQNRKVVSLDTKIFLFYQLANGLRFLRDQGIVHNDVKPQNVLLKVLTDRSKRMSTFIVRLIDFGESSFIGLADTHKKGFTHPYASPEKLRSQSTS